MRPCRQQSLLQNWLGNRLGNVLGVLGTPDHTCREGTLSPALSTGKGQWHSGSRGGRCGHAGGGGKQGVGQPGSGAKKRTAKFMSQLDLIQTSAG